MAKFLYMYLISTLYNMNLFMTSGKRFGDIRTHFSFFHCMYLSKRQKKISDFVVISADELCMNYQKDTSQHDTVEAALCSVFNAAICKCN